tara:strand:+ start:393 stop:623 length:231 start_codon:yes stop_codon:yes gene_type:complete
MGEINLFCDNCIDIYRMVEKILGPEKAQVWMTAENPNLGGSSPATLIASGRYIKVLRFVEQRLEENKADLEWKERG